MCIHDNTFNYVGRNGISLINVTDVLVKHNRFNHVGYHAIDIEPNFDSETVRRIGGPDNVFGSYSHRLYRYFVADARSAPALLSLPPSLFSILFSFFFFPEVRRITIRDNVFGSYSHRSGYLGYFVADAQVGSGVGATVAGITIADNRVGGIAANGYDGTPLGLDSKFLGSSGNPHAQISFTGNRTSRTVSGRGIVYCSWVDGFNVARNVQPMGSGTFVVRSNC